MPVALSIRFRTDSLATIWFTVTCLPTSRRNSSTPRGSVQSALSTRVARFGSDGREVEDALELALDGLDVGPQRVAVEQVALVGPAARVADHARGPAGQRVGAMAGELEPLERHLAEQVADVEAVGGRVEAARRRRSVPRPGGPAARRGRWRRGSAHAPAGRRSGPWRRSWWHALAHRAASWRVGDARRRRRQPGHRHCGRGGGRRRRTTATGARRPSRARCACRHAGLSRAAACRRRRSRARAALARVRSAPSRRPVDGRRPGTGGRDRGRGRGRRCAAPPPAPHLVDARPTGPGLGAAPPGPSAGGPVTALAHQCIPYVK